MGKTYNGHPTWETLNVAEWIRGEVGLYNLAKEALQLTRTTDEAAEYMGQALRDLEIRQTPDGVEFSRERIRYGLKGLED
jgi:hypothetical protein